MTRALAIALVSAAALLDGPAATTGRVVSDETGEPIVNARVRVTAAATASLAITDANGRFTIGDTSGPLTIAVMKSGYVRREERISSPSRPVEIRLARAAVISGRVVDRLGEPIVNAPVLAEAAPHRSAATPTRTVRTDTDDHGEFRLAGLPAGLFVVAVQTTSPSGRPEVASNGMTLFSPRPVKTYFPGAATADDAEAIVLRPGEERSGVDFVLGADQTGFGSVMFAGPVAQNAGPSAGATGAIRGRVSANGGRPLTGALVRLLGSGAPIPLRSARSDAQGRFDFEEVPPGSFRLAAVKPGYAPAKAADAVLVAFPDFGAGPPVDLRDGETRENVDIELARLGTIAGVVSDELGDAVQGASVQLLQVRFDRGRRRLESVASSRLTDDRGGYRIFGVRPGHYIVTAAVGSVNAADLPGYARSYYPNGSDAGTAQYVSVAVSQDVTGIDFALEPIRTATIAGKIVDSSGAPTMAGRLLLRPNASGAVAGLAVGASISRDGAFSFPNVPPGQYMIVADRGRTNPSTEGEFAAVPVAVDGADVPDVSIQMSAGSAIAGRITFDVADPSRRPAPGAVEISPVPADLDLAPSSVAIADIASDWTFHMKGVHGVRRLEATRLPAGWALREVRAGGIDVTDRPIAFGRAEQSRSDIEVVLTDRVSELAGTVSEDRDQPAIGAQVIVFSTDRGRRFPGSRFLRQTRTGVDGTFAISGLPDGSYYVAVPVQPPLDGDDSWQDDAFLDSLISDATTVTMRPAERQTLKIKTAAR